MNKISAVFMRTAACLTLLFFLTVSWTCAAEIRTKRLGNSGQKIGILSLNAVNTQGIDWRAWSSCISAGANLIVTSPLDEEGERFIGQNLGPNGKKSCLLATSWQPEQSETEYLASFQRSLKNINTGYIDCVIIGDVSERKHLRINQALGAFRQLKSSGKTKYLGMRFKDVQKDKVSFLAEQAVRTGDLDFIVIEFNVSNYSKLRSVAEYAGRQGLGVVAANVLEENEKYPDLARRIVGKRSDTVEKSTIKWLAEERWVTTILVTPRTAPQAADLIRAAEEED